MQCKLESVMKMQMFYLAINSSFEGIALVKRFFVAHLQLIVPLHSIT